MGAAPTTHEFEVKGPNGRIDTLHELPIPGSQTLADKDAAAVTETIKRAFQKHHDRLATAATISSPVDADRERAAADAKLQSVTTAIRESHIQYTAQDLQPVRQQEVGIKRANLKEFNHVNDGFLAKLSYFSSWVRLVHMGPEIGRQAQVMPDKTVYRYGEERSWVKGFGIAQADALNNSVPPAIIGAGIGFFVGGPLGAGIGAIAGAAIGGGLTEMASLLAYRAGRKHTIRTAPTASAPAPATAPKTA